MTRRLAFATGNAHKVTEVAAIVGPGWQVEPCPTDVEETGTSFEANALLKARAALPLADGALVVAEDSGIVVDALGPDEHGGGRPGIRSARWTEESDWIPRVLRELDGVEGAARSARYVAAVALVWPSGREETVTGTVEGRIAASARGAGGFGYDPIFVPDDGDGRTFAEMTETEKHALSHRGRAFRAALPLLDGTPGE